MKPFEKFLFEIQKYIIILLLFFFICYRVSFSQIATVTETKQKFLTYSFSDPSPISKMNNIYPYFRFDGYTNKGIEKEWKIIILENNFIKVFILPEIGGKVWGAIEKSTGKDFIYFNKVVKFRDIAMRGAWTSGGIEFNFGDIGHTPSTSTPVDYLIKNNPDSSASCFIGGLDLPSRTEWRVEIRLPADKAYFETKSMWYNPTEINTSFYNWSNAAISVSDDLHLFYPGKYFLGHDGTAMRWSIDDKGRDISIYGNNKFESHKSYHVMGEYTRWFGGIWQNDKFGTGHYSLYEEKPGKKIWLWSLARDGEIWKDLLTDPEKGNKQYVEIQTGLLFNQAATASTFTPFKHYEFSPGNIEIFNEAWFPIKGLENIVDANLFGTLSASLGKDTLFLGICPLRSINDELIIKADSKIIYKKIIKLNPLELYSHRININAECKIEIVLGNKILYYANRNDESKILNRPVSANKDFDWNSVYGLFTDAVEKARQRNYSGALKQYSEALKKDPNFNPALTGISEIYFRQIEYEKALSYIQRALANDTYDPDANFIYGMVNNRLNNKYDALDGFGWAKNSMKYRSTAFASIAAIYCKAHEYDLAKEFSEKSLAYNKFNINAFKILVLANRYSNEHKEALNNIDEILKIDPLNHFARFEKYQLTKEKIDLKNFNSLINNELPQETYLENASFYFNLELWNDAIKILSNSSETPIVCYWLAYLYDKIDKNKESNYYLEKAISSSPILVFPFRTESSIVLEWSMKKNDNWKTKYYLALIYWHLNRLNEAKMLFNDCGDKPDYAPFYLSRAEFNKLQKNETRAVDYEKALKLDDKSWRVYHLLVEYYNEKTIYDKALTFAKNGFNKNPESYILKFDLAKCRLYNGEYKECLDILNKIKILPYEGARDGREVYWLSNILQSLELIKNGSFKKALLFINKSEDWPENLGVGKPYDVDVRLEDFLKANCYKELGDELSEKKFYEKVINSPFNSGSINSNLLLTALSYRALNNENGAANTMDRWIKSMPDNKIEDFCMAIFNRDMKKTDKIIKDNNLKDLDKFWIPADGDLYFKIIYRFFEK